MRMHCVLIRNLDGQRSLSNYIQRRWWINVLNVTIILIWRYCVNDGRTIDYFSLVHYRKITLDGHLNHIFLSDACLFDNWLVMNNFWKCLKSLWENLLSFLCNFLQHGSKCTNRKKNRKKSESIFMLISAYICMQKIIIHWKKVAFQFDLHELGYFAMNLDRWNSVDSNRDECVSVLQYCMAIVAPSSLSSNRFCNVATIAPPHGFVWSENNNSLRVPCDNCVPAQLTLRACAQRGRSTEHQ